MTVARKPSPRPPDDPMLTVEEVAALLHVRHQRIYELIAKAGLPAIRLGSSQIRIRRSRLEAWLEKKDTTVVAAGAGRVSA